MHLPSTQAGQLPCLPLKNANRAPWPKPAAAKRSAQKPSFAHLRLQRRSLDRGRGRQRQLIFGAFSRNHVGFFALTTAGYRAQPMERLRQHPQVTIWNLNSKRVYSDSTLSPRYLCLPQVSHRGYHFRENSVHSRLAQWDMIGDIRNLLFEG